MSEHELVIRTGADLYHAFQAPEPHVRAAVLHAIHEDPAGALACGRFGNQDVIDLLLVQCRMTRTNTKEWYALLQLLSGFQDPRAVDYLVESVGRCLDPTVLSALVQRLRGEPMERHREYLGTLLLQHRAPEHTRAAAALLEFTDHLDIRQKVRLSVLTPAVAPEVDDRSEAAWIAELRGPFPSEARLALEGTKVSSFSRLRARWIQLENDNRIWLLDWGARAHPVQALELIDDALSDPEPAVRIAAIQSVEKLGPAASLLLPHLERFVSGGTPAERLSAIRVGAPYTDWPSLLRDADDPELRLACIPRLAEADREDAVPELLPLLESDDWQIRAAACDALAGLGDIAAVATRPLLQHSSLETRVAATRVLLAQGRDEWLQSDLLSASPA